MSGETESKSIKELISRELYNHPIFIPPGRVDQWKYHYANRGVPDKEIETIFKPDSNGHIKITKAERIDSMSAMGWQSARLAPANSKRLNITPEIEEAAEKLGRQFYSNVAPEIRAKMVKGVAYYIAADIQSSDTNKQFNRAADCPLINSSTFQGNAYEEAMRYGDTISQTLRNKAPSPK